MSIQCQYQYNHVYVPVCIAERSCPIDRTGPYPHVCIAEWYHYNKIYFVHHTYRNKTQK